MCLKLKENLGELYEEFQRNFREMLRTIWGLVEKKQCKFWKNVLKFLGKYLKNLEEFFGKVQLKLKSWNKSREISTFNTGNTLR